MIIDSHTHLGKATYPKWSSSPEDLLREMDTAGVDRAVVFPQFNVVTGDYREQNQWLAGVIRPHPDRLTGFARINPAKKNCVEALEESMGTGALKGVKLHSEDEQWGYTETVIRLMREISKHRLPVFLHSSQEILEKMAGDFPDTRIIFAHMAGWPPAIWDIAKKYGNILVECSRVIMPKAYIGGAVNALGAERVIFGSNFPVGDIKFSLKCIEFSGISEEARQKVTCDNILGILGK